jgi:hypothetical protein
MARPVRSLAASPGRTALVAFVLAATAAAAGCAGSGVVLIVGSDTNVVRKQMGLVGYTPSLLAELHEESDAFCLRTGRLVETIQVLQIPGNAFEQPAAAEMRFRCVPA